MGGGGSQTINQTFNLSAVNKSIFNQITKNKSESAASQANVQNLKVVMKNVRGCSSNFNQKIDATTQSSSKLTAQTTTEIKNAITNDLQASAAAAVEKATQMGNFQFGDRQNVNQEVTLAIENVIENTITTENINKAIADQVSIQDGELLIDGYDCREGGDINWSQNIVAKLSAEAITTAIGDSIASSEILNKLHASASGNAKSENKGFSEFMTAFFEGLYGPVKWIALVIGLLCIGSLIFLFSGAGQNATRNLGRAGANRLGRGGGMGPRMGPRFNRSMAFRRR
jgi:hypothetical protein